MSVHQTESTERAANKRNLAIDFAMFDITHIKRRRRII
jgi:hypothetical protein